MLYRNFKTSLLLLKDKYKFLTTVLMENCHKVSSYVGYHLMMITGAFKKSRIQDRRIFIPTTALLSAPETRSDDFFHLTDSMTASSTTALGQMKAYWLILTVLLLGM